MSFIAKYGGICEACLGWINEGDECKYTAGDAKGVVVHVTCPDSTAWTSDEKRTPICMRCFTVHRGEC